MPISLQALKAAIRPDRTALVLGAGSSVPSGGPTGTDLARILWKKVANSDPQSDDLQESASFLVHKHGRRAVVEAVVAGLVKLKPTGGILALPKFGWSKLFTTNFDLLLEQAYRNAAIQLTPIRSNFDFTFREASTGTRLFKIHGCITQDESLGHRASMILTEDDYVSYRKYRQSLFAELQASLMAEGDALVIGQSLRDRHLADLIRDVLEAKQDGAPGNVYALIYDRDDLRAPLLENKGARIAFGGLDEFVNVLAADFVDGKAQKPSQDNGALPLGLVSSTFDVPLQARLPANTTRMFNGGPATYADISTGATFERARHSEVTEHV